MNFVLLLIAYLGAVNPARAALAVDPGIDRRRVNTGATIAFVIAVVLVAGADTILDWIDTSATFFRIAAGTVVGLTGAAALVVPPPAPVVGRSPRWSPLVPVLFPILLTPALVTLAISTGADYDAGRSYVAAAVAIGLTGGLVELSRTSSATAGLRALSRFLAAGAIVAAIVMIMDGIIEI